MKKTAYLLLAAISFSVVLLSSCGGVTSKEVKLESLNDSVNYTLAVWQGGEFKKMQFQEDKEGLKLKAFIAAMDDAYNTEDKGEMYNLGVQVGQYIKKQTNPGLFGDSTLVGNEKLILQGVINALNEYEDVMTAQAADSVVQAAVSKAQTPR